MGDAQLSDETAAMLADLRAAIQELESLPLDEVPPALGDSPT